MGDEKEKKEHLVKKILVSQIKLNVEESDRQGRRGSALHVRCRSIRSASGWFCCTGTQLYVSWQKRENNFPQAKRLSVGPPGLCWTHWKVFFAVLKTEVAHSRQLWALQMIRFVASRMIPSFYAQKQYSPHSNLFFSLCVPLKWCLIDEALEPMFDTELQREVCVPQIFSSAVGCCLKVAECIGI